MKKLLIILLLSSSLFGSLDINYPKTKKCISDTFFIYVPSGRTLQQNFDNFMNFNFEKIVPNNCRDIFISEWENKSDRLYKKEIDMFKNHINNYLSTHLHNLDNPKKVKN